MGKRRKIYVLRRLALGLAVAALVAPAAQARVDDGGAGLRQSTPQAPGIGDERAGLPNGLVVAPEALVVSGDDKAGLPQPGYVPFLTDFPRTAPADGGTHVVAGYPRALPSDYGVPVQVVRSPSGFDWSDALVGAGSALGLIALAGGGALAARRRVRPAAA